LRCLLPCCPLLSSRRRSPSLCAIIMPPVSLLPLAIVVPPVSVLPLAVVVPPVAVLPLADVIPPNGSICRQPPSPAFANLRRPLSRLSCPGCPSPSPLLLMVGCCVLCTPSSIPTEPPS
jgi:hypothetical protein